MLMDAAPSLLWIGDPEGKRTYVNRLWSTVTGRPLEEHLGDGWLATIHPDDAPTIRATLHACVTGRRRGALEYRLRRHDGAYRWISEHATPLLSPGGAYLGHVGLCRDVTDRKHRDECDLAGAERAMAVARRVLATTAHDLLQPLATADLLARQLAAGPLDATGRDTVERLQLSIDSMRGMFEDLADLALGDRDARPPRLGCCPVAEVVSRAALLYEPVAAAKGLRLATYPYPLMAVGNTGLLERIVRNLVDNAVKYTSRGRVLIAVRPAGREARLQVWDSGAGIAAERLRDAFTPFQRLEEHGIGRGIGLYTVRALCDVLGHDLIVRSTPGRGSLFELRLPLMPAPG